MVTVVKITLQSLFFRYSQHERGDGGKVSASKRSKPVKLISQESSFLTSTPNKTKFNPETLNRASNDEITSRSVQGSAAPAQISESEQAVVTGSQSEKLVETGSVSEQPAQTGSESKNLVESFEEVDSELSSMASQILESLIQSIKD